MSGNLCFGIGVMCKSVQCKYELHEEGH